MYFLHASRIVVGAGYLYKIGKTHRQPIHRSAEIDLLLPFYTEIDFAVYVDDMDWWESMFHRCLERHRLRGEWFDFQDWIREELVWQLWGSGIRERHENDVIPSDIDEIIEGMREYYNSQQEVSDVN